MNEDVDLRCHFARQFLTVQGVIVSTKAFTHGPSSTSRLSESSQSQVHTVQE
jgi:hypothetical protein